MIWWPRRSLALALAVAAAACAGARGPAPPPSPHGTVGEFRLGPGDVVEVVVWANEGLGRKVPVRPDGMISLPLVGDVVAVDLTPAQLRDRVAEKLRRYLADPSVAVVVQEIHSPKVTVVGEVPKPGRFELTGPMRVLDAIALAGGFGTFASGSRVFMSRRSAGRVEHYELDRDELTHDGRHNVWLAPGDVVFVP